MPKVSIITPIYNMTDIQYEISAESLHNQSSQDFEWIVIDDGSTEKNYVGNIADIALNRNYGPSVARNIGFQISNGDIITYLDMGDALSPNRVENVISLFSKYDVEVLFSAYNIHYPDGVIEKFDHFDWLGKYPQFPTAFEYIQVLQKQNITVPLGVAHTRKPFVLAGGFQRGIVCGEDGILWRRMVDHVGVNKGMFSDDIAGTYYVTRSGQSRTQRRFEMGGFAFDGSRNDNGKYLDQDWYATYSSKGLYE